MNSSTHEYIEDAAHDLQTRLWRTSSRCGNDSSIESILLALEPARAIETLGHQVVSVDSLGVETVSGSLCEVAGVLNRDESKVYISNQFPYVSQRFTLGHEAAHIILDAGHRILHRDIPLERRRFERDWRESRANRFSSAFLMPRRLIEEQFSAQFQLDHIALTERVSYALFGVGTHGLRGKIRDRRDFSMAVASSSHFNGRFFTSLERIFRVSRLAMAIRLEELDLVRW
jgi:Zn-dependent peptidase ImmA (M78 family)